MKECLDECPSGLSPLRTTKMCTSACMYFNASENVCEELGSKYCPVYSYDSASQRNICQRRCSSYVHEKKCVSSCPSSAGYIKGDDCVASCPGAVYNKQCVEKCPSAAAVYENECYSICPNGLTMDSEKQCV